MTGTRAEATAKVLGDVAAERGAQEAKWGQQNHVDGTGPDVYPMQGLGGVQGLRTAMFLADAVRERCGKAATAGTPTWRDVLLEEVFEALAEDDPEVLRAELVQVAAVAVQWVEAIDRRTAASTVSCTTCGDVGEVWSMAYDGRETNHGPCPDCPPAETPPART